MKINRIKDFESFFKVVDKCKGRVDIVSPKVTILSLTVSYADLF